MGNTGENESADPIVGYVDASFCQVLQAAGLGGVLVGPDGGPLTSFSVHRKAPTSFDAEKTALLQGVQRIKRRNPTAARLYSDCESLVTSIQQIRTKTGGQRVRPIDRRLRQVIDAIESAQFPISIAHVGRSSNRTADSKAREGLKAARMAVGQTAA